MNELKQKPVVELFDYDGLGLIVLCPSGVIYTNQVGGTGCFHPRAEGVFVPLPVGHKKILFALQRLFDGGWHHLAETNSRAIDKMLMNDGFGFIKVDADKLGESFEAWIYVDVAETNEAFPLLNGFGRSKGVLTWENSD